MLRLFNMSIVSRSTSMDSTERADSSGDEVHAALALLLLELERDAAHGATLDALHEVRGETGDLVAKTLEGDDGDILGDALVRREVESERRE